MRADGDIQFAPVEIPQTETQPPPSDSPDWLTDFFNWLGDIFGPLGGMLAQAWPVIYWVLIIGGGALFLIVVYRVISSNKFSRKKRAVEEQEWVPEESVALQLLEDADRLAQEGNFAAATHLLLQRSVGQIAEIRPDLIDPSSTAREISSLTALPDNARNAFAIIAERVERSLFALTSLSADDWQAARSAYSEFALGYQGAKA